MVDFEQQLLAGARRCQLVRSRVLVAVSGGADSIALLRGLHKLRQELELNLVAAHLNHGLRGEESDADEQWLAQLTFDLSIPFVSKSRNIKAYAEENGMSVEEAARTVRYDFLDEVACKRECPAVAVAHTADDQVETILHHIVRGTGLSGLRGMQRSRKLPSERKIVRPLLEISREVIEIYLHDLGQTWREDATNTDARFTRNRIRHQLLPLLKDDYNPRVGEALRKLGAQAEEIESAFDLLAEQILSEALSNSTPETARLDCEVLAKQPGALLRHCLVAIWKQQQWPRQQMSYGDWNRLAEMIDSEATAITLPGNIEARRRGKLLVLRRL